VEQWNGAILFSISFWRLKVNRIPLRSWRASWDSYDGGFSIHSINSDSMTTVCHRDYHKKRCAQGHSAKMSFYSGILYTKFFDCGVSQDRRFFIRGRLVHKNTELSVAIMHKCITRFRHSLTKSTFSFAENGDGQSFSSHPTHSTDREGSTHAMCSETTWLKLFNEIGVCRVLSNFWDAKRMEFLNPLGHSAKMSLWDKNHVELPYRKVIFLRSVPVGTRPLRTGTLRKNVSLVQKSRRTSIERSFFAECPSSYGHIVCSPCAAHSGKLLF
jgi:hypothetical protein